MTNLKVREKFESFANFFLDSPNKSANDNLEIRETKNPRRYNGDFANLFCGFTFYWILKQVQDDKL